MTAELFTADLAATTVTSGGTGAPSSGTSETWTVTSSAMFGAAATGVSQFHIADTATGMGTEMIAVTNVSGTTWTVTRGAESTTPVAHSAGFTVCQVVTAGFLTGLAPLASPVFTGTPAAPTQTTGDSSTKIATDAFVATAVAAETTRAETAEALALPKAGGQFWVADYGAKADGKVVGDGAMTSGSAVLTSATASFASGDVGKNIIVNGALGASSAPLYTTILSFTNSTTVTLNANATNTVTAAAVFWASDDSAAIVSCITAASTYAQANNWKAQVLFQARSYGLATLTTTAASGALAQQNALVPIPYPNVNGTTRKLIFELIGVGESADEQYFDSTIPSMTGTCLVATVAASGTSPSVIGGPNASTNLTGTWINTKLITRGVTVWCGFNPGWIGWDLRELSSVWADSLSAQVLAPPGGGQSPGLGTTPANTSGWGVIFPANNDNGAGRVMVEGYYQGVGVSPRTTIEKLFTESSAVAVFARTVNATVTHGARIGYWSCQNCTTAISSTGTSGTMPLVIDMYDSAGTITTDLSDAHGTLVGSMNWWHTVSTAPAVAAGFAMRITNLRVNPGPVSSPASPPSSGVAWQNLYWRDAEVTLSVTGGFVTALTIDGADQHIPAACVLWKFTVPSGHSYTPTYTGTLVHDVTLE
jgi:hypothetical protein